MNKTPELSNIRQKKRRYKLLYKKLIDLKKNVQNRLKIINFKKKKWRKFIESLQKTSNTKKQIFRFHDQTCDYVSKSQTRFKWNYKKTLQAQKRFNYYYGYMLKNYLKIQVKIAKQKRKVLDKNFWVLSKVFIDFFERRLDTILYRAHFVCSMRQARQLISHKHIKVNGKIVDASSYQIKNGDLIDLVSKKRFIVNINNFNYLFTNFWPIPGKHLQINYRTYQIIFVENLDVDSLGTVFPFHLDLNGVIKYYN